MQLDNQKEIAEMQNETQKEIAGIQSATSRFFFNDTATTEIYTLSPTRRSSDLGSASGAAAGRNRSMQRTPSSQRARPKRDRKSTRLNSSHGYISYAVFCLKKKKSVLVLMLPLLVWLTQDLRSKKSLLKCSWTIRKRLPRCKMRLKKRLLAFSRRLHVFFLMIRRPPRSTLFPLHDALPISAPPLARQQDATDRCRGLHPRSVQGRS